MRRAVAGLDLRGVRAVGLDETASKRGHNYVTVFIDMDRRDKPVIFVIPGKGKACVAAFASDNERVASITVRTWATVKV